MLLILSGSWSTLSVELDPTNLSRVIYSTEMIDFSLGRSVGAPLSVVIGFLSVAPAGAKAFSHLHSRSFALTESCNLSDSKLV